MNSKWLMVGSGAIGCEHLKNLAYMNVGAESGEIIITDPDTIEKSNLNRQFLFRSQHIGKLKSEMAASAIKQMKPLINIKALGQRVGSDNTDFTDNIMVGKTGVLNALDNVKARRFMDEQCFKFGLPLFESGTTGTKGNTQSVIPFITETYSASTDEQDKSFPICTIKSFPNEIQHTIHWAMDQFEFFNRAPQTLNKWINVPNYLDSLSQVEKTLALEDINQFASSCSTHNISNVIESCARWAVNMFNENYTNSIIQLLNTFGPNHQIEPGVPFWSSGKRCPKPINFDINNDDHIDYVEATTHLLIRCYSLPTILTREELKQLIHDYKPTNKPTDKPTVSELTEPSKKPEFIFTSQEFEKDDDTNWHVKWITSSSNMRALNYSIPTADYQQTKGIAGHIIPAISTTTSAVSGLILIEMLKYLMGYDKVNSYRSTFINLAEPLVVYSDPIEAPMIDIAGVKVNAWTKFDYTKNTTLDEFKKYYEKIFETNITMIVIGTAIAYADFLDSAVLNNTLSKVICDTLEVTDVPSNITFNLASDDESKDIPSINVNLLK